MSQSDENGFGEVSMVVVGGPELPQSGKYYPTRSMDAAGIRITDRCAQNRWDDEVLWRTIPARGPQN